MLREQRPHARQQVTLGDVGGQVLEERAQAGVLAGLDLLVEVGVRPERALRRLHDDLRFSFTARRRFVRGCDGAFSNLTAAADIDSLTCAGTTTTLPDSIAITYEADQYNTIPTSGGTPTDCLGGSLPVITASMPVVSGTGTVTSSVTYYKADNRFYIGTSSAIVNPSLYCKGNGTPSPQPMVENVEDMQITYGTLNTTGTSTGVAGYLEANEITSVANLAALANDAARWKKVITARICIVVRSETTVVSDASSAKYLNCQGSLVASPDLRLRKAYSTTVELRN